MPSVALRQRILVSKCVIVPKFSFIEVGLGNLPATVGIVDTLLEALSLLLFADMQKKLDDPDAVVVEQFLEFVDLVVAARPNLFWNEVVNAHDENIFVNGAIEDSNVAVFGNGVVNAPQIIVRSFFGGRFLE